MKYFDNLPISYLEIDDISNGKLNSNVTNGKKTIIMVQGNFCGYCTKAKPAFAEVCNKTKGKITCSTIQTDGNPDEKKLGDYVKNWDKNYRGVPTYLIFSKDGTYLKTHDKGRDTESILKSLN